MEYAKSVVALIGSIATALLGIYGPETQTGHILTVVLAVATAVGTWAVENKPTVDVQGKHEAGRSDPLYLLVVVILAIIVVWLLVSLIR